MEAMYLMNDLPQATLKAFGGDTLRARVFREKYGLRDKENNIVEEVPAQMWNRLAEEMASVENESDKPIIEEQFYDLLEDYKFIPGGRIMFGAGQPRNVTLLNCYVIPMEEDSLDGIFKWCHDAAKTYSYGGGVGGDISILRPQGASVNNCAVTSTGAVSFMDLMSKVTGTIGQAGRRGALMITIDVTHPDIVDFIDVKNDEDRINVRFANVSVKITDDFMRKLEEDGEIELEYEGNLYGTIKAKTIWDKLIESAHASAEPGVMFWDRMVEGSPTEYNGMNILTTNPCGEQPLDPYNNCCLGSLNLKKFVLNPFTEDAKFDLKSFEDSIRTAVRFLDNVISYNQDKHALQQQADASAASRRIGLGVTGLGDMFVMMGVKYDSQEALQMADRIFNHLKNLAYEASTILAEIKGTFPKYDEDKHLQGEFVRTLDSKVIDQISEYGLRNACILTIPPVGSGSVLAGTSSGIEPIFALSYGRRSETLTENEHEVYHPLCEEYNQFLKQKGEVGSETEFPAIFREAHQIEPKYRVELQAVIQKHIDSSISSTVNLPEDITLEEVDNIYRLAWKLGCKGITVYREGSREGILQTKSEEPKHVATLDDSILNDRPVMLDGKTYRVKTGHGNLYLTVNTFDSVPIEIFVNIGKSGLSTTADAEALGRVISLALRRGATIRDIISQLQDIGGNRQIYIEGSLIKSVPDAIAKILEKYYLESRPIESASGATTQTNAPDFCKQPERCYAEHSGGCVSCKFCLESKCD